MKANELSCKELMVGDWVKPKNVDASFRVGLIGVDSVWNDTDTHEWDYNELEPIPLTTEILEKNGFENIGDDTYQLEEKPCWFWVDFFNHQYGCEYDTSTYEYEDDEHRLKLYGIPSVHQLQQALRLCGIEKTIEL